jgi:hypothetical protein
VHVPSLLLWRSLKLLPQPVVTAVVPQDKHWPRPMLRLSLPAQDKLLPKPLQLQMHLLPRRWVTDHHPCQHVPESRLK